jgi:hypothetical protein
MQKYVDLSTETITPVSMSMGGGPVFALQLAHVACPADREAARAAMLTHAKKELARMVFSALRRLVPGGSTGSSAPPTAAVLLGMDITMTGGEEACSHMTSITEIQQAASEVRRPVCRQPTASRVCAYDA